MSIFEMMMLVCFGSAWPFSIYKSYTSGQNGGKSIFFLFVVFTGYCAGIVHKLKHGSDPVIFFYITNATMVAIDIVLYFRNLNLKKYEEPAPKLAPF
jgi:hypothetical protein